MNELYRAEVVDLGAHRERRARQQGQKAYLAYLASLEDAQLEGEAEFLLEEFSGQDFGAEYREKVQLYFGELSRRAGERFGQAIDRLAKDVEGLGKEN